jgi:C-terminal processing protease CtpA/Prc
LTDSAYCQSSSLEVKNNYKAKGQLKKEIPFLYRLIPFNMLFPKTKNNCYLIKQPSIKPWNNPFRFHGNIYVLTSEFTFSSASNFACTIKDYKIIGQETGGLASCYGPAIALKLPNTKIDFQVSYLHVLRPAGFDDGHGVIPDILIENDKWTDQQYYDFIYNITQNQINKFSYKKNL